MKLTVIGNPTSFLVLLMALDDEVLVLEGVGGVMRFRASDDGNVSPKHCIHSMMLVTFCSLDFEPLNCSSSGVSNEPN